LEVKNTNSTNRGGKGEALDRQIKHLRQKVLNKDTEIGTVITATGSRLIIIEEGESEKQLSGVKTNPFYL